MRFRLAALLLPLLACPCFARQGEGDDPPAQNLEVVKVYEIKAPSNTEVIVPDSHIIATTSGLRFQINSIGAAKLRGSRPVPDEASVKEAVAALDFIYGISVRGLAALPRLAAAVAALQPEEDLAAGHPAIREMSAIVTDLSRALRAVPEEGEPESPYRAYFAAHPDLANRINAAILSTPKPLDRLAVIFKTLREYAKEQADLLVADTLKGEVTLLHMRSNDASRVFDVGFGAVLDGNNAATMQKLRDLHASVSNGDPEEFMEGILDNLRKAANKKLTELRSEADTILGSVREDLKKIVGTSYEDSGDKERVDSLKKSFEDFQALIKELQNRYSNFDLATPEAASEVVSDVNRAYAAYNELKAILADLVARPVGVETAHTLVLKVNTLWMAAKDRVEKLVNGLKGAVEDLARLVVEMFNLGNTLEEIGRSSQSFSAGQDAVYSNVRGTLDGFASPLLSGDELVAQISIKDTATNKEIYKSTLTFYVYKEGVRQEQLFNLILAPRSDSERWSLYPSYTHVFKITDPANLERNRLWSVGAGFNVATLDQDGDGDFELGTGIAATLLDDRLMVGWGHNFSLNRGYWFLGWRFRLD